MVGEIGDDSQEEEVTAALHRQLATSPRMTARCTVKLYALAPVNVPDTSMPPLHKTWGVHAHRAAHAHSLGNLVKLASALPVQLHILRHPP